MAFDLDNEELKATRRDKGLDDGLYEDEINRTANEIATNVGIDFSEAKAAIMQFSMSNKTSDKNVVNIEDDVNKIKEIIKRCEDFNKNLGYESEIYDGDTPFLYKELEHILEERVQDKKRIQELEAERQMVGMPVKNKRSGKIGIVLHQWKSGSIAVLENINPRVINTHESWNTLEIITDEVKQVQTNSNSIPKQKIKEALEDIEDYFERLNGPDKDIEYIRQVKQELLEKEESRNE